MTIVRVGLAETKNYGDGWNAIFSRNKKTKTAKAGSTKRKAKKSRKK